MAGHCFRISDISSSICRSVSRINNKYEHFINSGDIPIKTSMCKSLLGN